MKIRCAAILFAITFVVSAWTGSFAAAPEAPPVLMKLKSELIRAFEVIDTDLSRTAKQLARSGITGDNGKKALDQLCLRHPSAIDCAAIDPAGRMITIRPEHYKRFEQTNVSMQDQVARLRTTGKPVMSQVFTAAEGMKAVAIQHPVVGADNRFIGSVSMLLKPESFLASVIGPAMRNLPGKAWVMQLDGLILYDQDAGEIGRFLFTDPLYVPYPSLIETGRQMARSPEGRGRYEFLARVHEKVVSKIVNWTTAGLYGIEWRIAITREE